MPNHITNLLEFNCSEDRFRDIAEYLRGDNNKDEPLGHVDFNVLIPMPEELMIESSSVGERGYEAYSAFILDSVGLPPEAASALEEQHKAKLDDPEVWDLGKKYYDNLRKYGAKTWYQWSYKNWGTKWNAYDCEPANVEDRSLCFHTAWDGVPKIITKIAEQFPDVDIVYSWADEDIGRNVGILVFEAGKETGSVLPENGSKQAFEMAAEIMGLSLKEMASCLPRTGPHMNTIWSLPNTPLKNIPFRQGKNANRITTIKATGPYYIKTNPKGKRI